MNIKRIDIENYKNISKISFEFNPQINIFSGINGSGKTTIINALSIALLQIENKAEGLIAEEDIRNNTKRVSIKTYVEKNNKLLEWTIVKSKGMAQTTKKSNLPIDLYHSVNNIKQLTKSIISDEKREAKLEAILKAIKSFDNIYSNLRVENEPKPHILIDKNGNTFDLMQLSDGEKALLILFNNIIKQLAPFESKEDILKSEGIVIIDEIDLHLHPLWQQMMIQRLTELFPNCQFFITTNSAFILSYIRPENMFLIKNNNGTLTYSRPEYSFGMAVDKVAELIMNVDARPKEAKIKLNKLYECIRTNKLNDAKSILKELEKDLNNDSELTKANVLIKRKEIIGK